MSWLSRLYNLQSEVEGIDNKSIIETSQRIEENLQVQADIIECVVDEYNTYIGG